MKRLLTRLSELGLGLLHQRLPVQAARRPQDAVLVLGVAVLRRRRVVVGSRGASAPRSVATSSTPQRPSCPPTRPSCKAAKPTTAAIVVHPRAGAAPHVDQQALLHGGLALRVVGVLLSLHKGLPGRRGMPDGAGLCSWVQARGAHEGWAGRKVE